VTQDGNCGVVVRMKRIAIAAALLLCACTRAADDIGHNDAAEELPAAPQPAPRSEAARDNSAPSAAPVAQPVSACRIQEGAPVPENAIRAVGTEPFWAVRVEGRCVTYSTPENQAGVRIWTRFDGTSENGRWVGALDGSAFVMETEPQPGCSDGMSDNRYPIAVMLTVRGEKRTGCAEPR
jgi:uncharacterized membrane protein